jgi:hypothetical protein
VAAQLLHRPNPVELDLLLHRGLACEIVFYISPGSISDFQLFNFMKSVVSGQLSVPCAFRFALSVL